MLHLVIYLEGNAAFRQRMKSRVGKDIRMDGLEMGSGDFDFSEFGRRVDGGDVIELRRQDGTFDFDAEFPQSAQASQQLGEMRAGPSLNSDVGQREERVQRVAVNVFQHRNADRLEGKRLESNESRETLAIDESDRIGRQVQMLEQRHRLPEESRD